MINPGKFYIDHHHFHLCNRLTKFSSYACTPFGSHTYTPALVQPLAPILYLALIPTLLRWYVKVIIHFGRKLSILQRFIAVDLAIKSLYNVNNYIIVTFV